MLLNYILSFNMFVTNAVILATAERITATAAVSDVKHHLAPHWLKQISEHRYDIDYGRRL